MDVPRLCSAGDRPGSRRAARRSAVRPLGPAGVDLSRKRLLPTGYVAPAGPSVAQLSLDPALQHAASACCTKRTPSRVPWWWSMRARGACWFGGTTTRRTWALRHHDRQRSGSQRVQAGDDGGALRNREAYAVGSVCISGGSRAIERRHLIRRVSDIRCAPFFRPWPQQERRIRALATHRLLRTTSSRQPSASLQRHGAVRVAGAGRHARGAVQRSRVRAHGRRLPRHHTDATRRRLPRGVIANGGISRGFESSTPSTASRERADGRPARLMGSNTAHRCSA